MSHRADSIAIIVEKKLPRGYLIRELNGFKGETIFSVSNSTRQPVVEVSIPSSSFRKPKVFCASTADQPLAETIAGSITRHEKYFFSVKVVRSEL